jgi:hypothetical protein
LSAHSITVCSACGQRIYGVMGRSMQMIYYNGTRQPMVAHGSEKPIPKKHIDKKGNPVAWTAITKLVDSEK